MEGSIQGRIGVTGFSFVFMIGNKKPGQTFGQHKKVDHVSHLLIGRRFQNQMNDEQDPELCRSILHAVKELLDNTIPDIHEDDDLTERVFKAIKALMGDGNE